MEWGPAGSRGGFGSSHESIGHSSGRQNLSGSPPTTFDGRPPTFDGGSPIDAIDGQPTRER